MENKITLYKKYTGEIDPELMEGHFKTDDGEDVICLGQNDTGPDTWAFQVDSLDYADIVQIDCDWTVDDFCLIEKLIGPSVDDTYVNNDYHAFWIK